MKRFVILSFVVLLCIGAYAQKAKYVFYFIGDGMGVNQINATEVYLAAKQGQKNGIVRLTYPSFPVASLVNTYSASHRVTDSAAGGTALSSGVKTYNKAIGLHADSTRVTTIAEKAKAAGMKVGVATTVTLNHATPACFYAHQYNRGMQNEIAADLPKAGFDFYAGSGLGGNKREEMYKLYEEAGYVVARGQADYNARGTNADKVVLVQEKGKKEKNLPLAIDRQANDLTLKQITEDAIAFLSKNNKKGFFVMLEGGQIDWACHDNDAASAFEEVIDFDNAIQVAYEFYKKHPKETLIVISADHETGGITLNSPLKLEVLLNQKVSVDILSEKITDLRKHGKTTWEDVKSVLSENMGFFSKQPLTWEQERELRDVYEESFVKNHVEFNESLYSKTEPLAACAKRLVSRMASIGWSTGGHTAGYVPVYAVGVGADLFKHRIDNTEIEQIMAKLAGLEK